MTDPLQAAIDTAFTGVAKLQQETKIRNDSQIAMLGAAQALSRYVHSCDPDYEIPQYRINAIFAVLNSWGHRGDVRFPCYFTAQEGRFSGDRLYLRCDDKEHSVFVLEDGSEEVAGHCHNFGICVDMTTRGSWQEITEAYAKELREDAAEALRLLADGLESL